MGFILCRKYIKTDANFKQVEHDIYDIVLDLCSLHERNGYED